MGIIRDMRSGVDRFTFDMRKRYDPYPFQRSFHSSTAPYGFLGGAAGPGKTLAMIMEQFTACNEFNIDDGPQVHTLFLRRTTPMLDATVITRFRETIPRELYKQYNETRKIVTWKNGATTNFGSMQYENDAWGYQGQWYHIGYDELCDFTFNQWMRTSAWNRCPVSRYARKYGAGNPIGVGALWVEDLFVKCVPCSGMDDEQKKEYLSGVYFDAAGVRKNRDYDYFPATYLDNPVYANDPQFLKNLAQYPAAFQDALKYGKWGAAGGYFRGVWDEAIHVFPRGQLEIKPWWKQWISGNWGYAHPASYYKHCMDDDGVLYTYDELYEREKEPEELAKIICEWAREGGEMPHFENFAHSFDAAATKKTATMGENANSVNNRMIPILRQHGVPAPHESTRDKLGRDTLMRERLGKRVRLGETAGGQVMEVSQWQVADRCTQLRRLMPIVQANEDEPEKIESSDNGEDSPLQGAGYGLYAIWGKPAAKPKGIQLREMLETVQRADPAEQQTARAMVGRRFDLDWEKTHQPVRRKLRWSRSPLPQ
jgi:hypothetical protein